MREEAKIRVSEDYLRKIERKVESLKVLIDVSTVISSTLELDDLMPLVMEKAKGVMEAEACSILFYNRKTNTLEFEVAMCEDSMKSKVLKKRVTLNMGQGIAGWVAENRKPLVIEDVRTDSRFYAGADLLTGFTTRSLVAVPLIGRSGLIGVAEIVNPRKKDYDHEIFELLCRQFAIAIENARSHKESLEKERLKQELEIASALQKSFLPPSPVFRKEGITISSVNISAAQVGGDIYDVMELNNDTIGFFIGDVSGKGISAALYMAKVISDFKHIAPQAVSPDRVLNRLNTILSEAPRGMFLTGIYGILDRFSGGVTLSVAGHPPFLWLTGGETRVMSLPAGPPMGLIPVEYPVSVLSLERGDRLLFLTDGVFDAKNNEGERIGFEHIAEFVKRHMNEEQLLQMVVEHVEEFSGGKDRADDLTLMVLSYGGRVESEKGCTLSGRL